ncbi:MAG: hypothetical protein V3V05_11585, partial [Pontiella sp.]
ELAQRRMCFIGGQVVEALPENGLGGDRLEAVGVHKNLILAIEIDVDAPILVCGELKKGSCWHGALDFQTGHFNLQSTFPLVELSSPLPVLSL